MNAPGKNIHLHVVYAKDERGQQDSLIKLFRWMVFLCCCCTSKYTWIGWVVFSSLSDIPVCTTIFTLFYHFQYFVSYPFLTPPPPPLTPAMSEPAHPLPRSIKTLFSYRQRFLHSFFRDHYYYSSYRKKQKSLSRWNLKRPQSHIDFILVTPFSMALALLLSVNHVP